MIDFPSSPSNGQQFTASGVTWVYDGTKWTSLGTSQAAGVYLPLAGGTLTGPLSINSNTPPELTVLSTSAPTSVVLDHPAGQIGQVVSRTSGNNRWLMALGNGVAESGSNAGSDFQLNSYIDAGTILATPLSITRSTSIVQMPGGVAGVTNGSNAAAGCIGEYVNSSFQTATPVSATATNITSLSLTAGDWDVAAVIAYANGAVAASLLAAAITQTSATLPAVGTPGYSILTLTSAILGTGSQLATTPLRFSLTATTTVYLVGQANFASGAATLTGTIRARRVR